MGTKIHRHPVSTLFIPHRITVSGNTEHSLIRGYLLDNFLTIETNMNTLFAKLALDIPNTDNYIMLNIKFHVEELNTEDSKYGFPSYTNLIVDDYWVSELNGFELDSSKHDLIAAKNTFPNLNELIETRCWEVFENVMLI
jgi:hypothetical protein